MVTISRVMVMVLVLVMVMAMLMVMAVMVVVEQQMLVRCCVARAVASGH